MAKLRDLAREYEERRFPPTRRLDLHGEGPRAARERALKWIQSFAHEEPGADLLLIVERGRSVGRTRPRDPVRTAVEDLLGRLVGGLIDWWQPFGPGSLALRIALEPRLRPRSTRGNGSAPAAPHEGRTPETAGVALPPPDADIPPDLLPSARRVAELRRTREGLSVALGTVLLRRVWIDAQAAAMSERISFRSALDMLLRTEEELATTEWD